MVYILLYSKSGKNTSSVVVSIMLGIFSFGMSVTHAISAKSSNVNLQKVQGKILERCESMADIHIDEDFLDEN